MASKDVGKIGENRIARYLKDEGWIILEKNFRFHKKEVDIIAQKHDLIIFVEVKTRKNTQFGRGSEAIDTQKRNNIIHVARHYIEKNNLNNFNVRFDVASIDGESFSYIENAVQV